MDCTCHAHPNGACEHPNVLTNCNCSGSNFSQSGTSTPPSGTKTTWSGGSGGSTTSATTGEAVYFELQKIFKSDYTLNALQKYTIINGFNYSILLLDFLNTDGDTPSNKAFTERMIYAIEDGQFSATTQLKNAIQNFKYSQKSPADIDLFSILDKKDLSENKKFIEIYDALTKSPEFKSLFLDIFTDSKKFNVKFEIEDHVYKDNDPTKEEVNAITIQDPITKNIIIKVSKQILMVGSSMSQTKIENAKTVLHECIHAYLFVKASNPNVGADFVKILNSMYPTVNEQHDFMYNKMIPTMQKVLFEIRDSVTTLSNRTILETQYTMHPSTNPLTSTSWIWDEYYKFLSLKGLDEANCFKIDLPVGSDKWNLFTKYIDYGHNVLD